MWRMLFSVCEIKTAPDIDSGISPSWRRLHHLASWLLREAKSGETGWRCRRNEEVKRLIQRLIMSLDERMYTKESYAVVAGGSIAVCRRGGRKPQASSWPVAGRRAHFSAGENSKPATYGGRHARGGQLPLAGPMKAKCMPKETKKKACMCGKACLRRARRAGNKWPEKWPRMRKKPEIKIGR